MCSPNVCHVVTLGRALELGHKPTVVSALSAETGQQFTVAGDALKTLEPAQFGKWASYLALKAAFYESYVSEAHPLLSAGLCDVFSPPDILLLWEGAAGPGEVWRLH